MFCFIFASPSILLCMYRAGFFAAVFNGLGATYGELGQFNKAVDAYLEATRLGPNYMEAQFGLGWSYFQIEEYDKAQLPLKIAIKIEPKN